MSIASATAVVRADAHPALAGKPMEHVACSETLAADDRVEVDEDWTGGSIGAVAIEVEQH